MIIFPSIYHAPVDAPVDTGGKGLESIVDFLNSEDKAADKVKDLLADEKEEKDDKPKDKTIGKDSEEEPEDGDSDDKEEDIELDEDDDKQPNEEDLEIITPVGRKVILKKYPNLFKEFPYLEKAMYREQQYTELLPTLDDAKEVVERVKTFDKFESELFSGNAESTLRAVKEADNGAFTKIVDNYLGNLQKVDNNAYYHVLSNVIKSTIIGMANEAKRSDNDNLQAAAQILNQFVFGTSEFTPPQNLAPQHQSSEKSELQQQKAEFIKEKFEATRDDLSGRVNNILKSTITQHVDPKGSMTEYVKKNATKDALADLEAKIIQDTRFRTVLDKLWEKAFQDNFSQKSTQAIKSAYLSKAKTLLPTVISKARNTALQGQGKTSRDDDSSETRTRTSQSRSAKLNYEDKKPIPRHMKTLDFLMQD